MKQKGKRVSADRPPEMATGALLRWAWRLTWQTAPRLTAALVALTLLRSLLPAAIALIGKGLIDALVAALDAPGATGGDLRAVWPWLLAGLAAALLEAVAANAADYTRQRLGDELALGVTTALMERLAALRMAFFEQPTWQDTIELAYRQSAERLAQTFYQSLALVATALQALSLLAIVLAIEPVVGLALTGLAVPYLLYYRWVSSRRYALEQRRTVKRRRLNYYLGFMIDPEQMAEARILGLGPYFIERCRDFLRHFRAENRRLARTVALWQTVFTLATLAILYLLLLRAAQRALAGSLSVGDVVLFVGAIGRLRALVESTARSVGDLREQLLYVNNLHLLLTAEAQMPGDQPLPTDLRGELVLRDVTFRYPGVAQPALDNISLHIRPGEVVALVGENGAGKTTLAKLIARLYDPDAGAVLVDGLNLADYRAETWYEQVSVVFQNFNRYEASAADNIAYGNWRVLLGDEAQIATVARLAGADGLIVATPDGYETRLGRRFGDFSLSTGQWQKIAIARALARPHSKLVILDEPAAHLDAHAEYALFAHFRALATDRTTLLVTHRLTTVSMADRILVLAHGRLVEQGTHAELMALNGHYAALYRTQVGMLAGEGPATDFAD